MFYVCPYMGKAKFPLQQSLAVLNETLEHIEQYVLSVRILPGLTTSEGVGVETNS
jgi:hypothetical protein